MSMIHVSFTLLSADLSSMLPKSSFPVVSAVLLLFTSVLHSSADAGGKTIFSFPRAAVMRSFVMNHMIHHRAVLCVYLRLNDLPVPGMYGPSGDEEGQGK